MHLLHLNCSRRDKQQSPNNTQSPPKPPSNHFPPCRSSTPIWSRLCSLPMPSQTSRQFLFQSEHPHLFMCSCNVSRFPPPRIFTNALLGSHDITALIRDTEVHERALFQVDPAAKTRASQRRATRRGTTFSEPEHESMAGRIYSARNNRNHSAVARVLGSDMMEEIKRSAGTSNRGPRGEVNIDVLLRGAEILCNV